MKSANTRSCVIANGGSDWVGAETIKAGSRRNNCVTRTKVLKYVASTTPAGVDAAPRPREVSEILRDDDTRQDHE